ncbi:MAG: apolipoprotein N-acyltransferase [Phenylobacterium sp.]
MSWRQGWIARGLALAAGLAAGLAHPPFGLLPGILGYALLLALIDTAGERPLRSAFFRGWLAGLGYFAVGTHWITEPFMVNAKEQGWMAPIALVLMAGGLALFWGAGALAFRAAKVRGWAAPVVFAAAFAGVEWLRGHVLTGFPWDLVGETWKAGSAPSQSASVVGAYGLTWITLLVASAPAVVVLPGGRRAKAVTLALAAAVLASLYAFGAGRLEHAARTPAAAPVIRVVQANIDQKVKWKAENLSSIVDTYAELSHRPAAVTPAIVIWPEGALPAVIDELIAPGSPYATRLRDAVEPGQTLMMGANRAEAGAGGVRYFNSLVAFRREADGMRVTAVYDKHRLVPFGEYMPLGELAGQVGFRSLVHMPDDFTAGPDPKPVAPWGVPPVQVLICYEALFPGFTREAAERAVLRPGWILNVSNDAWFGVTSGPLQHLNIASYRAIEEGLPIVRVTPTGVSAVIDAYGRIAPGARLGLGAIGIVDAALPPALQPTPFYRAGDLYFAGMLILSALIGAAYRVQRAKQFDGRAS